MDAFLTSFETVIPLFLVITTGLIFSKAGAATIQWVDILNKYALWIGFPALVIVSLMQLQTELKLYMPLILLNSAYIIICMLLSYLLSWIFRLPVKVKQAMFLILPFGNVAYLGIPVLENAYGEEILPVAAILASVYIFWMLTLALVLVEVHEKQRVSASKIFLNLVKNPLLLSVFAGTGIVYFQMPVPGFAEQTLRFFSQSVTAVVLFSLGIFLGMQTTGNSREWIQVAVLSLITIIVLPALFYSILTNFSLPSEELKASILEAAMPTGLTPYALSVQYNLVPKLFARTVVFATTLSVIVLPLWIFILQ